MYFKRLEMQGFKSFAEPVVIEFHEGITCIVGPNGSGKSNISDAIRWVLGEQSPKALRGGKMEEVIFAGTENRKSRGMAEVTLVIDNSSGILNIDYNEVAITRRMYRSGESEYLINNNQCRLKDIRELIMDTGIGVDGYSIIGQGKIADIVGNKPESRREIFEEAAGVVLYKSKKAEAGRKLEGTANNLDRVNDIIAEIEGRIDGLKIDSEKAIEYLDLKDKYEDLEINIILRNIESQTEKLEAYKEDIVRSKEEIDALTAERVASEEEEGEKRAEKDHLETLANEARARELALIEEINKITNRRELNEERLSGIEREEHRINDDIENLQGKVQREEENLASLENDEKDIMVNLKNAEDLLKDCISNHSAATEHASEMASLADEKRERLFELQSLISSRNSLAKSYESIKDALSKRKQQLEEESKGAEKNRGTNFEELEKAKTKRDNLRESLKEINEDLLELENEKRELEVNKQELHRKIEETKLLGGQKSTRKKTIEEMEHNYEGYNMAVRFIMQENLKGIKGVASDLMTVPFGYETAIETALGGQLQNIICDTDSSAKYAINLLKRAKAGRLTFLPVESVKGNTASLDSRITGSVEYLGLGSECVSFKKEYQGIFEYLLGRVAIVKNMDAAIEFSKYTKGVRFVTLEGEVITGSGAITGGVYKNKTANFLERKSEIQLLENEIKELRASLSDLNEEQDEINDRFEDIKEIESSSLKDKHEKEVFLASLESTIDALESSLADMDNNAAKYSEENDSIGKELSEADEMINSALSDVNLFQNEITTVKEEIEQALTAYEERKKLVEKASEEITKVRISVRDWENKKDAIKQLANRITETIDGYKTQILTGENDIKALNEEKNQIIFGDGEKQVNIDELLKEKQDKSDYIVTVTEEREKLSTRLDELSAILKASGEKINASQDVKYQAEIKSARIETQLDSLKDRLFDEFEISYAEAKSKRRDDFVMSTSQKESRDIRNRIKELGEVNVSAIKEYEEVSTRYTFLTEQRTDIIKGMDELKNIIREMDSTIKKRFKDNFDQVVKNFESIFKELFGGGYAELRMEDESNPLESGIEIIAQPPGKKLQNINLMSGGEKTMTAIALMFAVLKTKPTPFCILDEVEAALDDSNIDSFANYLRNFNSIQFALITHQKATMEHADVLYGVTMAEHGVSKLLSLRLGDDFEL